MQPGPSTQTPPVQTWPAPGQVPQSFDLWQPSPITPQYWPPVGVHDTGVQGGPSGVGIAMSTVGFTSAITGASLLIGTSALPPSLPPDPGVALTPAVQPASNAVTARDQREARGPVGMGVRCPLASSTVQAVGARLGFVRILAGLRRGSGQRVCHVNVTRTKQSPDGFGA